MMRKNIGDVVRYLSWDEDGLQHLAGIRLAQAVANARDKGAELAWQEVFEDVLSYWSTKSFNYIVDRTLYRPREIIQFCNECLSLYGDGESKIDYDMILRAESVYSSDRFSDICSEYRFQMPDLKRVLEFFRGRIFRFSRQELEEICLEIVLTRGDSVEWVGAIDEQELIERLWSVGFIKALAVGGEKGSARSGSRWVGSYQSPNLDLSRIETFQVHPMFRAYLNMKEK